MLNHLKTQNTFNNNKNIIPQCKPCQRDILTLNYTHYIKLLKIIIFNNVFVI